MNEISIFQADYGYALSFKCQTYSGDIKDLSGYTVRFHGWAPGEPATLLVSGLCTVTSGLGGQCIYIVTSANFLSADHYYASLEATMSGVRESFESFVIKVAENA